MSRALRIYVARAFRRAAVPLASYYAVTLAVPVANGAARSDAGFLEHALAVLIVPALGVGLASAAHTFVRAVFRAGAPAA